MRTLPAGFNWRVRHVLLDTKLNLLPLSVKRSLDSGEACKEGNTEVSLEKDKKGHMTHLRKFQAF